MECGCILLALNQKSYAVCCMTLVRTIIVHKMLIFSQVITHNLTHLPYVDSAIHVLSLYHF